MKHVSSLRIRWMERHRLLSNRARLRQRKKAAIRRRSNHRFQVTIEMRGRQFRAWAENRISMPRTFCLHENYSETVLCLNDVQKKIDLDLEKISTTKRIKKRKSIKEFFDLSTIKNITPGAALVFASEFDRMRAFHTVNIPVIERQRWQANVKQLLTDIGFFDLLEIDISEKCEQSSEIIRILRFQTGELVGNTEAGNLIKKLAEMIIAADIDAIKEPETIIKRARLFDALVEATENARHHAYPDWAAKPHRVGRWWMTGAIYPREKRLTIVVYDQGVSIPGSLSQWSGYPWIKNALRRLLGRVPDDGDESYDAHRLRLAMKKPRSSTGMANRGKGLPLLKEVVDHCIQGRLRIISRRGALSYDTGGRLVARALDRPLSGTLIEWDLWL